jgi:hypothetical protein
MHAAAVCFQYGLDDAVLVRSEFFVFGVLHLWLRRGRPNRFEELLVVAGQCGGNYVADLLKRPRDDLGPERVERRVFGQRVARFELKLARVIPDPQNDGRPEPHSLDSTPEARKPLLALVEETQLKLWFDRAFRKNDVGLQRSATSSCMILKEPLAWVRSKARRNW